MPAIDEGSRTSRTLELVAGVHLLGQVHVDIMLAHPNLNCYLSNGHTCRVDNFYSPKSAACTHPARPLFLMGPVQARAATVARFCSLRLSASRAERLRLSPLTRAPKLKSSSSQHRASSPAAARAAEALQHVRHDVSA